MCKSSIAKIFFLIALAGLMLGPSVLTATEFTADMIQKADGATIEGKLFVDDAQYRLDIGEGGHEVSIIISADSETTKKTLLLLHSTKMFQEVEISNSPGQSDNPFETYKDLADKYEQRELGTEVIDGQRCKKIEIYDDEQKRMTAWVSEELGWPVKITFEGEATMEVELKNIQTGSLEASLFQVPSDYRNIMSIRGDYPTTEE